MTLQKSAGISILDKSVILSLPFCVFAGYSVLTHADDSLALESFFMTGYVKYY